MRCMPWVFCHRSSPRSAFYNRKLTSQHAPWLAKNRKRRPRFREQRPAPFSPHTVYCPTARSMRYLRIACPTQRNKFSEMFPSHCSKRNERLKRNDDFGRSDEKQVSRLSPVPALCTRRIMTATRLSIITLAASKWRAAHLCGDGAMGPWIPTILLEGPSDLRCMTLPPSATVSPFSPGSRQPSALFCSI